MLFFINSLYLNLKKIIINPLFLCTFLLLALCVTVCVRIFKNNDAFTVNVGILSEESGGIAGDTVNRLMLNGTLNFILFDASQEEEMTEQVRARRLECAYILKKGLTDNIKQERFNGLITLICSPATVSAGIVSESVFAALINSAAADMSAEIAADMFSLDSSDIIDGFTETIRGYHERGIFINPNFVYVNSYEDRTGSGNTILPRIIRGVWITVLFIFSYFLIPVFINDKNIGFDKLLSKTKCVIFYFAKFLASFIAALALALSALLFTYVNAPVAGVLFELKNEMIGIILYLLCVTSLTMFCSLFFKTSDFIHANFTPVLIIQIIFGGVFLDLGEFGKRLSQFQVLPSAHYMNYLQNHDIARITVLAIISVIFTALNTAAVLLNKKLKR